jgi:beta-glucanase (GH16 family)
MKKINNICMLAFAMAAGVMSSAQTIAYNGRDYIPETNPNPMYVPAANAATAKPGYTLTWSEEFNHATDAQLHASLATNWNYASGNTMGTHYGTVTEQNTHLHTATTDHGGSYAMSLSLDKLATPVSGYDYGSAFIMSKEHFIYGYYEARCKLQDGKGAWPAFWLFGNNGFNTGEGASSTPTYYGSYGEIDIFENFPDKGASREVTFNAHAWHYDNTATEVVDSYGQHLAPAMTTRRYYVGDVDLADEYHIYAIDFTPTAVSYYLDGVLIGTLTDASFIAKLAKQGMWVCFDNALESSLRDYSTPNSNKLDVDYVRVYKKNQVLSMTGNTCNSSGNTVTLNAAQPNWYSTLPTGKTISYQWTVTGSSATISGPSNMANVTVSSPSNGTFVATCSVTVVYPDFYTTNTSYPAPVQNEGLVQTFKYPNDAFSNSFTIGTPQCINGQIQVTVTGNTVPGGLWQLWNTDVNGNFTGSPLQAGYGANYTFTGLTQNTVYAVTRGVWDACTPWNFVQKNFTTNLTDFSLSAITCSGTGNKLQVTCTALSSLSGSTTQWQLYTCDVNGNTSGTPVNASGTSWTYNNLIPGQYYKIFRNASSGCALLGSSTNKIIYVHDFYLDPFFAATSAPYTSNPSLAVLTGISGASAPTSWWGVYNSNAAGDPLSQLGSTQFSNGTVVFGPPGYSINYNSGYYLLVRSVYGECSNWYWKGKLFHNGTLSRTGNPDEGIDIEFTPEQIEQLNADAGFIQDAAGTISLELMPNPANADVTVRTSGFEGDVTIQVLNLQGEIISQVQTVASSPVQLNLESYPAGVYLVRVYNEKFSAIEKLIRN